MIKEILVRVFSGIIILIIVTVILILVSKFLLFPFLESKIPTMVRDMIRL